MSERGIVGTVKQNDSKLTLSVTIHLVLRIAVIRKSSFICNPYGVKDHFRFFCFFKFFSLVTSVKRKGILAFPMVGEQSLRSYQYQPF